MLIFLTGHRKSGTTLLHSLFDNHPEIDVYPTDFTYFYSYFPYFTDKTNDKKKLIKRIIHITNHTLNRYFLTQNIYKKKEILLFNKKLEKRLNTIKLKSKRSVFEEIINHWLNLKDQKRKKHILIKETSQSIYFNEYKKIFKNMKMINLVRDPRDNYASIKSGQKVYYEKMGMKSLQNFESMLFRSRQDLLSCFYNKKDKRFKIIFYENLVKNPKSVMKSVSNFLKIKYSNSMLSPTFFGKKFYGNNFDKKFSGISKKSINKWKKRISKKEALVIEFYLSDVMKIFNYKISSNVVSKQYAFSKYNDLINSKYFFKDSF